MLEPVERPRAWTGWGLSLALHAAVLVLLVTLSRFFVLKPSGGGDGGGGSGLGTVLVSMDLSGLGATSPAQGDGAQAHDTDGEALHFSETAAQATEPEQPLQEEPVMDPRQTIPSLTPSPKNRPETKLSRQPIPQRQIRTSISQPKTAVRETLPGSHPGGEVVPGSSPGRSDGAGNEADASDLGQGGGNGGGEGKGNGPSRGAGRGMAEDGAMSMVMVEEKPKISKQVEPEYPETARRQRIEGQVVARFLVTAKGDVDRINIISSQPPRMFDQVVREAVGKWRFRPARFQGRNVAVWVMLPIRFNLKR